MRKFFAKMDLEEVVRSVLSEFLAIKLGAKEKRNFSTLKHEFFEHFI